MTSETQASSQWPAKTISSDEDGGQLDRALSDLMKEGQRIQDETLDHGGEYPDTMPQAIKLTDAQGSMIMDCARPKQNRTLRPGVTF